MAHRPERPADLAEAERQVREVVERHREVVSAMEAGGRPSTGQQAAVKAVGRAVALVAFVLRRARDAGVTPARLAELSGWERAFVEDLLERPAEPERVAPLTPPGIDPRAVAQAAASVAAAVRLQTLLDEIAADVEDEAWSPAAADLDDLRDRLAADWRTWRGALGRRSDSAAGRDR
jgi:hypothetical protein